jgi:hypothetical protein
MLLLKGAYETVDDYVNDGQIEEHCTMYSLWHAYGILGRILSGERYRKATPDEKVNDARGLNLVALMVLYYPWFMMLVENKYSHTAIWLATMAFLAPTVFLMYWNGRTLPLMWNVLLSAGIITVPISFLILSTLGVTVHYNRTISAVVSTAYVVLLVLANFRMIAKKDENARAAQA